jgi:hypothetical protein
LPVVRRLRQEGRAKIKASLGCIVQKQEQTNKQKQKPNHEVLRAFEQESGSIL